MRVVILIATGMHTKRFKPCIAFLAFTAYNWELCCNTDLIQKKAFSVQNMMVQ